MKLWDKGFDTHQKIEKFTIGDDRTLDLKLAKYDVQASLAHAEMLNAAELLTNQEFADIEKGLKMIRKSIENDTFEIESEFEDVHSKIEFELGKLIGESAKKIHTARSRNDQVLVDLHLYVKDEIKDIKLLMKTLFSNLIKLSKEHKNVLMPGYTHFQVAMPSSFGLWFSAYAESLIDDLIQLNAAYKISDQNPLGSAAGYGSSFPIDREMTRKLLGFATLKYNVVSAQMSRGKLELSLAFVLSSIAGTLSKFATDICLYNSQNFGFISFPDELTTGSSIMPHKKNPDVIELIRASCNKIQALPAQISMVTNNLPSGYHRDFQLLKSDIMQAIDLMKDNLEIFNFMIGQIEINTQILSDPIYDNLYSVEAVNELVKQGNSFRDAYKIIAKNIASSNYKPTKDINHTHIGSLGNLCLDEIVNKFNAVYFE